MIQSIFQAALMQMCIVDAWNIQPPRCNSNDNRKNESDIQYTFTKSDGKLFKKRENSSPFPRRFLFENVGICKWIWSRNVYVLFTLRSWIGNSSILSEKYIAVYWYLKSVGMKNALEFFSFLGGELKECPSFASVVLIRIRSLCEYVSMWKCEQTTDFIHSIHSSHTCVIENRK